jgi:hypothetical protein
MNRGLVTAIILATLVRGYFAIHFELAEDEAYYWTWTQHLDVGYFDHPPMVAWWIGIGNIFGHTEFWVRFIHLCSYPVLLYLFWMIVGHNNKALWIVISSPLLLGSFLATPDTPLLLFWVIALLGLQRNIWWLVSIGIVGACLSKFTGLILIPIAFLSQTSSARWRTLLLSIVGLLPLLWWNFHNDWISFLFQWQHISNSASYFTFFLSQWALFGIVLFPLLLYRGFLGAKENRLAYTATYPLILIGLIVGGEANWIAPAYIGAAMLLGGLPNKFRRIIWVGISCNLLLLTLMIAHAIHPLRGFPHDPMHRLQGGKVLGESIEAWGETEIWCTRYQEASLIWFYSGIPTHTIETNARKSQFDLWRKPLSSNGLFVRPTRNSEFREIEQFQRTTSEQFEIEAYSEHELYSYPIHRWQVFPFTEKKLTE